MRVRVAILAAVVLSDCLDPTEILVVVSTDVPCNQVNSTAIAVGKPGDDKNFASAKTTSCSDDGGLGTLVVLPSHGMGDDVGIRVTLGVNGTAADTCVQPDFTGCIVARRSLAYIPHRPLTLPIVMQQICAGNACDPYSTCLNGSCVDAGIPSCDQTGTCRLDAGVPDAGSCVDIAPKLVTPVAAQVTPRLVQTATGYAIGWETALVSDPSRAYDVVELDASGKAGKVVQIVNTLAAGFPVGPLGTDGTNFAATFVPAISSYGFREIDPNGLTLHEGAAGGLVQLPRAGMRYEPAGPAFIFFFIGSTGFPTFEYWPLSGSPAGTGVGASGGNDPALAYFNGVHYGSYQAAGACELVRGDIAPPNYQAQPLATFPLCTTLRVAENAKGVDLAVTRETDSQGNPAYTLKVRDAMTPTSPSITIDSVADQAIVALAGTGSLFHVVYGVSQGVRETIVDVATRTYSPPVTIASTGFTDTAGIGFDAIAEPGTMIHDVAFWSSTPTAGIYFTRICN